MTAPQDPFTAPGPNLNKQPQPPPGYGSQPGGYGPQPGYGSQPGPHGYGAPGYGPGSGGPVLAPWGTRVAAYLVDVLLVMGIIVAGFVLGAVVGGAVSETLGALIVVVAYLAGFGFLFWQLAVQGRTGQTIGKKQMRIRLLREQDGQVVGAGLSIGRYFVHIVDAMPFYVGYLWPLWDPKKQTFADKLVQTVVVRT